MPLKAKNFVIISPHKKKILCFRCHHLPLDPMQCQNCDVMICGKCFKKVGDEIKCPKRAGCTRTQFEEIKSTSKMTLQNLKIRCKICKKVMDWNELQDHENECIIENKFIEFNEQMLANNIELTQSQPLFLKDNIGLHYRTESISICTEQEAIIQNITFNTIQTLPSELNLYKDHNCNKIIAYIVATLILFMMGASFFIVMKYVFLKDNAQFYWVCVGQIAGINDICLFSFGQFAIGIIAIGQVAIGIFSLSQVNIGLLFGIGQLSIGIGFNAGLGFACSSYSVGIFALGLYKIRGLGYQCIDVIKNNKSGCKISCQK